MAENKVAIDGAVSTPINTKLVDAVGHALDIRSDGSINTVSGVPDGSKFYVATLADAPGVVASNNFLSIFNPVGSGRNLIFFSSITIPWATASTNVTVSMNVYRTTAASGGTLQSAANIGRFVTADGNPVAEVRTGNPTVTTSGLSLLATPPAITTSGSGASPSAVSATNPAASFVCTPGQGIVWNTASGSTGQLWNIQVVWCEF